MNKRLAILEKMVGGGSADAFTHYALALEYRRESRVDEARAAFEALKVKDPEYLPMYLMAGQLLSEAGQTEAARGWLEAGITVAQQRGDMKTLGELESELAQLK
jgi:tetratricopeptide (TPR) repeat protein